MPASRENIAMLRRQLDAMRDQELERKAMEWARSPRDSDKHEQWEVQSVDVWLDRECPGLDAIGNDDSIKQLSLPGLRRYESRLMRPLKRIRAEIKQRRKRGHPAKSGDMWVAAIIHEALLKRHLTEPAKRFLSACNVSARTLRRYKSNPVR